MRSINKNLLNYEKYCISYEPLKKFLVSGIVKYILKLNKKICPQCKDDLKVLCI